MPFMIFILEGCLELAMTCSICLSMLNAERFSTFSEILSTCLTFFFTLVLAVIPIWSLIVGCIFHRAQKLKDEKTVKKYLPLFEGKRLNSLLALQYPTIFIVRRYVMIALIFISKDLIVQLVTNSQLALLSTCYILYAQPFTESNLNKQEIVNELTILGIAYTLYVYALIVKEDQLKFSYEIGWFHIGVMGTNWIINLIFMVSASIYGFKLRLRRYKNKKAAQK